MLSVLLLVLSVFLESFWFSGSQLSIVYDRTVYLLFIFGAIVCVYWIGRAHHTYKRITEYVV